MPKPKRLSGNEVIVILERFGFFVASRRGSHVRMTREVGGDMQTLTVTNHKELKTGAVVGIFRQACRFISESDLREHFYSD